MARCVVVGRRLRGSGKRVQNFEMQRKVDEVSCSGGQSLGKASTAMAGAVVLQLLLPLPSPVDRDGPGSRCCRCGV